VPARSAFVRAEQPTLVVNVPQQIPPDVDVPESEPAPQVVKFKRGPGGVLEGAIIEDA
jgi:hypothetical protein